MAAFQTVRMAVGTLQSLPLGVVGFNVVDTSALPAIEVSVHAGVRVVPLEGAAAYNPLYHSLGFQDVEVAVYRAQTEVGKHGAHTLIQPESVGMRLRGLQKLKHVFPLPGVSDRLVRFNHRRLHYS